MLTKNFHQLQTEVQRVKQGSYDTSLIDYLAEQGNEPSFIESEYGIPLAVFRIAEAIFENLPSDEAPAFFAAFSAAVESDGKDLSRVVWQFLAAELRLLPPVTPEVQAVINPVIDGIDLLAEGKEWSKEDAMGAARAADSAADWAADWAADSAANAAADAAADAAWAAAWAVASAVASAAASAANAAARAARLAACRRQRDLLLKLITEAPITQQENN